MGMQNAMTAHVDDASALFYNPAGMVRARTFEVQVGSTAIIAREAFTGAQSGTTTWSNGGVTFVPHAYALYNSGDVSVGLGYYTPFGAALSWPGGFEGRFLAQRSVLRTYDLNPQAAFRIIPRLRVGLGIQIVRATVELERALSFVTEEGQLQLGGGAWGFGANLGVQVDAIPDKLEVGAIYRSAVGLHIVGAAHFANTPTEFQGTLFDQTVTTDLVLPDKVAVGIAYWPRRDLRLALDISYFSWQRLSELSINFLDDPSLNTFNPKRWHHAWSVRVGAEWKRRHLVVRGGLSFDQTPVNPATLAPDIPDGNRIGASLGVGYRLGGFSADLAYQLLVIGQKVSNYPYLPGRYGGLANVVGLTLGYRL
jgi:long-chain fatty acid transport protein